MCQLKIALEYNFGVYVYSHCDKLKLAASARAR